MGRARNRPKNIFEAIQRVGSDDGFTPIASAEFTSSQAPAGTEQKIAILRRRLELGLPLWHEDDRADYDGCVAAIRPRGELHRPSSISARS